MIRDEGVNIIGGKSIGVSDSDIRGHVDHRQIIRSGTKSRFSVNGTDTSIDIIGENDQKFLVFFNVNHTIDNTDGFTIEVPDQTYAVQGSLDLTKFYISVDTLGLLHTTNVRHPDDDMTRVHLISYVAKGGDQVLDALQANPVLSSSDRTFSSVLTAEGVRVLKIFMENANPGFLDISRSEYMLIGNSVNYAHCSLNPHTRYTASESPMSWAYIWRDIQTPPDFEEYLLLDPTKWDDGGSALVDMPQGVKASVQVVLVTETNHIAILYGQQVFDSLSSAFSFSREVVFVRPHALQDATEVYRICMDRNATDSSDISQVIFVNTTGASGGSGTPVQGAEFIDDDFSLKCSSDFSKIAKFDACLVSAETTNHYKLPYFSSSILSARQVIEIQTGVNIRLGSDEYNQDAIILVDTGMPFTVIFGDESRKESAQITIHNISGRRIDIVSEDTLTINGSTDFLAQTYALNEKHELLGFGNGNGWIFDMNFVGKRLAYVEFSPEYITPNVEVEYRVASETLRIDQVSAGIFRISAKPNTFFSDLPFNWVEMSTERGGLLIKPAIMASPFAYGCDLVSKAWDDGTSVIGTPGRMDFAVRSFSSGSILVNTSSVDKASFEVILNAPKCCE